MTTIAASRTRPGLLARLLSPRVPIDMRPVPAVAAANAILETAWRTGQEVAAPRLQRLVMLCDHACETRTGRSLVEETVTMAGDMPYHDAVHGAFRAAGTDPIRALGNLREIAIPHLARIDAERMAIIEEVVALCANWPTHRIPRMA